MRWRDNYTMICYLDVHQIVFGAQMASTWCTSGEEFSMFATWTP